MSDGDDGLLHLADEQARPALVGSLERMWDDASTWFGQTDDDGLEQLTRVGLVTSGPDALREQLQTSDPDWFLARLRNYGSLFLGPHSTVAFSDKSIGTNHVLPTGKAARYTGGLWVGKFTKTVTYQKVTEEGTGYVAPSAADISDAEFFYGHALTCRIRLERSQKPGQQSKEAHA